MTAQARRNRSTETPSAKKSRQLFEQAGGGRRPPAEPIPGQPTGTRRFYLTGSTCGACANWPICIDYLGKSSASINYCARPSLGFSPAKQPTNAEVAQALADGG
jgi:hypothetical protein